MPIVVVADPDLRERMRCIRAIAGQTPVSLLGAATWEELDHALEGAQRAELIIYAPSLPGAPEDAIAQLLRRTARLVLAADEGVEVPGAANVTRVTRPIAEETLLLMAHAAGAQSTPLGVNFVPVDFLQMICMSGDSHVLVVSSDSADVGVIEVRRGKVWTAFDALGVGEAAFARLIRPEMRVRVTPAEGSKKERTIFKDLSELLLDSLRRIDEGSVELPPPISSRRLEVALASPEQMAIRIKQLNADARRLLMERSYSEAARVLTDLSALDPASSLVRANLEQLRKLGYPR
ncbi:hypothetical protein SOCE26_079370 [Sorangium cellulosum]|uniref:PatA-like N-terminal domain-containing protein n=1 Tax=Sorangium cellulosum TaxID=56 RepID=A0A2L0F4J7_SORCE|nr:DUF4388 domain-containing protein [Sorangium cellulosum]AUX46431.1 hypothetical protein SOCE26_079370 [Sorangium cellulosum]